MAQAHDKTTLEAMFKEVYGDSLVDLVPDFNILSKMVPFKKSVQIGDEYIEAVKLTSEQGFTYGGGIQTLSGAETADVDDARIRSSNFTLQSAFSYKVASAMTSSKGAFETASKFRFGAMLESASHRLELQMLYGGEGLGVSDSSQDGVTAVVNTQDVVIPITPASYAAGIWAASENAYIELHSVAADAASAVQGADATVNKLQIRSVDPIAKSITVICKDATEAAALVAEIEAEDYKIRYHGSFGNEMVGLRSIASNSGVLYGVDGSNYSLWQGNVHDVGATNLTYEIIIKGLNRAVSKGLMEKVCLLVSPDTFATLASDQASLRRYNASEKKAKNGHESIEFYGPSGPVEIKVHPMMRDQEAIAIPPEKIVRLGTSDLTFNTPGRSEEMFLQLPTQTGYECRLWSDQAIFLPCPAKCVLFTNIDNS